MSAFDFLGFDASPKLLKESRKNLTKLLKLASGVVGHDAYIIKTKMGFFEGSLKIHTAWDSFVVSALRESPEEVLVSLFKKMKEKIVASLRQRNPILPSARYWFDLAEEGSSRRHK